MMDSSDKPKVLIVDDTPENIQILMETLKDEYKNCRGHQRSEGPSNGSTRACS